MVVESAATIARWMFSTSFIRPMRCGPRIVLAAERVRQYANQKLL